MDNNIKRVARRRAPQKSSLFLAYKLVFEIVVLTTYSL